jgi:hypothetical protein
MKDDEIRVISRQCASLADGMHTVTGVGRKFEITIASLEDDGLLETTLVQSL